MRGAGGDGSRGPGGNRTRDPGTLSDARAQMAEIAQAAEKHQSMLAAEVSLAVSANEAVG